MKTDFKSEVLRAFVGMVAGARIVDLLSPTDWEKPVQVNSIYRGPPLLLTPRLASAQLKPNALAIDVAFEMFKHIPPTMFPLHSLTKVIGIFPNALTISEERVDFFLAFGEEVAQPEAKSSFDRIKAEQDSMLALTRSTVHAMTVQNRALARLLTAVAAPSAPQAFQELLEHCNREIALAMGEFERHRRAAR